MSDTPFDTNDILRRSEGWYETKIRDIVEKPNNIGKMVLIDSISGDYEIVETNDHSVARTLLCTRRPEAQISGRIIGHDYSVMKDRPLNPFRFAWSDAWLLLSIVYAGSDATLTHIIGMGDMLNVAIFNDDELIDGISRLIAAGFVQEGKGMFTADDRAKSVFREIAAEFPYTRTQVAPYSKWLCALQPIDPERYKANREKYAEFIATESKQAYKAYSGRHAEMIEKLKKGEQSR